MTIGDIKRMVDGETSKPDSTKDGDQSDAPSTFEFKSVIYQ